MTKVSFDLRVEPCAECKKLMMEPCKSGVFDYGGEHSQEMQMKAKGIVFSSHVRSKSGYVCVECAESDKAKFTCHICGKIQPHSKMHSCYGDDPDYLYKDCYNSSC